MADPSLQKTNVTLKMRAGLCKSNVHGILNSDGSITIFIAEKKKCLII